MISTCVIYVFNQDLSLINKSRCGGLDLECSTEAYVFAHLVPNWWRRLGRLWDLEEGKLCGRKVSHWRADFRFYRPALLPVFFLLFPVYRDVRSWRVLVWSPASQPRWTVSLQTVSPINPSVLSCFVRCFAMATKTLTTAKSP